jgi:streptogramin lyase
MVTTLAGSAGSAGSVDGMGSAARFDTPSGITVAGDGTIFVADAGNHTIREISAAGMVTTLAGSAGSAGSVDGMGSAARFDTPSGITVAGDGTIFVADAGNHTIREISAAGMVTTLAGNAGSSGAVDGMGSVARFYSPRGIAVGDDGIILVADAGNHTIREVSAAGMVTTLAGNAGSSGAVDGTGSAARFDTPGGITVTSDGTIYVADTYNHTIRAAATICCEGRVGDANGQGGDEPTISDISVMIDAKFISGICEGIIQCLAEADVNQSGGSDPTCDDITISDISILIDYLFITGPETATLLDCL